MAPPPRGTRPLGRLAGSSGPPAEALAQDAGRRGRAGLSACPEPVLGPREARRSQGGLGVVSPQGSPHPGAPTPVTCSRIRFLHRWGPPPWPQAGAKRGKWPRNAAGGRSRPQGPGDPSTGPGQRSRADRLREGRCSPPSGRAPYGQPWGGPCAPQGGLRPRPGLASPRSHHGLWAGPGLQETQSAHLTPPRLGRTDHGEQQRGGATRPAQPGRPRPPGRLPGRTPARGERQPPSSGQGPFFYIGGTNGASIISSYCRSKGWRRTHDGRRGDYALKWCEVKSRDSYCSFREGEQLLYQLPNNSLLTTKIGLPQRAAGELAGPDRGPGPELGQPHPEKGAAPAPEEPEWTSFPGQPEPHRILKMEEFFPETYRLDIRDEREAFFALFDETQMWICKPTASNQGKGIFLLRSQEEVAALQTKTQSWEDDPIYRRMWFRVPQARVVQRYIQNPLLLDGKKFDVRSYLLIACAMPCMVFFGHGYARLTLSLYNPHSRDLSGHLTNQFMQKKSPLYPLLKEDTVWSMDQLNRYINSKFRKPKGLPRDWVFTTFTRRMQQIMAQCFLAVKPKLECKLGYFDLIGCDFLIDENFKVWLLEMNANPALHTNCEVLREVIPGVVVETLDLALETFQKSLTGRKMLPLLAQRRFVLLHNGEPDPGPSPGAPRVSSPDGARDREAPGPERPRAGGRDLAQEPSPGEHKGAGPRDHRDHRGS
ncbi:LOW QUALITY PROTEIN: inactive polyglycylase TTLL10 [Talpa occidentalis]|uniref:LOW QUALITY PROTEIN: inactive polyglycylase TTLL10 n=1 Tax=Talpa occidentalis TaxID=50954 RepID=UPI0023F73A6A|nr:LOW QUALITY PROTEIN: inactive polyglycylase TTLL10 [Talpa occidentalis]